MTKGYHFIAIIPLPHHSIEKVLEAFEKRVSKDFDTQLYFSSMRITYRAAKEYAKSNKEIIALSGEFAGSVSKEGILLKEAIQDTAEKLKAQCIDIEIILTEVITI